MVAKRFYVVFEKGWEIESRCLYWAGSRMPG